MSPEFDPFWKLRPPPPTPADEICSCEGEPAIILMGGVCDNPIACISCNLEVPPERIGFDESLSEAIHHWNRFHGAFYTLWLDSGAFEKWAETELCNPIGEVSRRGRIIVSALNKFRRTYYSLFYGLDSDENFAPPTECPYCHGVLSRTTGKFTRWVCDQCSVLLATQDY